MATRRNGKPYIYATWLAQLLGGKVTCLWSVWFKAHFRYTKFQTMAGDLVQWTKDHDEMMRLRVTELDEVGWTVTREEANEFKLEGEAATIAGKPDLLAVLPKEALVIDGKTGKKRQSDWWQVWIDLYALPKARPDLVNGRTLRGEIQYKTGDERVA